MRKKFHYTNTKDRDRARQLRREGSSFEHKLWAALREISPVAKLKFRRQQPIHPYIADFACMEAKLIIELDGYSHDTRQAYDRQRDTYLAKQGYTVFRINNDEVIENLGGVVDDIVAKAKLILALRKID